MFSRVFSTSLNGLSAQIIEIEASIAKALRAFNIVGLPDKAIEESKERINAAIKSTHLSPPHNRTERILINLAPADLKKEGSLYDLPIALGYLLASEQIKFDPSAKIILGELSLDGKLRPIKGALAFSLLAQEKNFQEIILPEENAKEASLSNLVDGKPKLKIVGVKTLNEAIAYLEGKIEIESISLDKNEIKNLINEIEIDIGWIKGQDYAKRAMEIVAAGGHNVLMQGPPGTGKTLLAKSITSILPDLTFSEILELTRIYSACGLLPKNKPFLAKRPFRSPHHSASEAALIGGGNPPRPGEITLAHRGILFLDEFPEFHRDTLESLRQPLEERKITISRARHSLSFPANFTLIAAANPCPCGYYGDPEHECTCTVSQIAAYRRKLSGPLIDRVDIFVWVPSLKYKDLVSEDKRTNNTSRAIKQRVEQARLKQKQRFEKDNKVKQEKGYSPTLTNSEMTLPQIKEYCQIDNSSQMLLKKYVDSGKLSARGYHKVLKTARTIADLENNENISFENVSEALMYQPKDQDIK